MIQARQQEDLRFCHSFALISKLAWPTMLSYTFSFEVFAIGLLVGFINESNDTNTSNIDGVMNLANSSANSAVNAAADTLIMTMLNSVAIVTASLLFAISIATTRDLGKLEELDRVADESEDKSNLELRIASSNRNGIVLALFILAPIATLSLYYSSNLLQAFGQNTQVAEVSQNILRPISLSVPALLLQMVFEQIMLSFRKMMAAMFIGCSVLFAATIFATCFGLGYGLPDLGFEGLAFSYTTGTYVACMLYGIYVACEKELKRYEFFNFHRLRNNHFDQLRQVVKLGWPIVLSVINEASVALFLSVFAGLIGKEEQASLSSVMQFFYFIFIISAAFGQVSCQEVSRLIGANKHEQASKI